PAPRHSAAKVSIRKPASAASVAAPAPATTGAVPSRTRAITSAAAPSLDDIEHRTFEFFWQTANPKNGLIPDHWPLGNEPFSSIAATGFALTAYPIGVQRGWITRAQASERVLATLRFFANAPQGTNEDDDSGY